ncbi:MAG: P1 family peptidase [Christensenellales bacterium]
MHSINPVVGECNDAQLNAIVDRPIREEHVREAIASACRDFDEGDVGAGRRQRSATGSRAVSAQLRGRLRFWAERIYPRRAGAEQPRLSGRIDCLQSAAGRRNHRQTKRAARARNRTTAVLIMRW